MPEQALSALRIVDVVDVGPARLAASHTISRIERAMKSREVARRRRAVSKATTHAI
jgi:hypothetical protein